MDCKCLPGKRFYWRDCVATCDGAAFSDVTELELLCATAAGGVYKYVFGFAIIVGMARSVAIHLAPWAEMFIIYLVLACVLAVRPQGIFAPVGLRKI